MTEQKNGLWCRCRDFVTEQSAGEWDDKTIANDSDKLMAFVNRERERFAEIATRIGNQYGEAAVGGAIADAIRGCS